MNTKALEIAFMGFLILLPIAIAVGDLKSATISIGLIIAIAFAYPLIKKETK